MTGDVEERTAGIPVPAGMGGLGQMHGSILQRIETKELLFGMAGFLRVFDNFTSILSGSPAIVVFAQHGVVEMTGMVAWPHVVS